jgi:hypothetical protein
MLVVLLIELLRHLLLLSCSAHAVLVTVCIESQHKQSEIIEMLLISITAIL